MSDETTAGIDLGTSNSEIAMFDGDRVRVLAPDGEEMLPSCVGLSASGDLLVGAPARNQNLLYPERTARGIKRMMGTEEEIELGDRRFSPQELSALLLRELVERAARELGSAPRRAVITVPAYFSDAQRQATREAGALAGLEVERILNEPTAACLAYGRGGAGETVMAFDLGGGTLDVSLVRLEGDVTEVLASHGDNRLGGDDFTQILFDHLADVFAEEHGIDLCRGDPAARSRLWWAAEAAKRRLSEEPYAEIREDGLVQRGGKPLHLELEIGRDDYDEMIRPLVEKTMESVTRAMDDSGVGARELDAVLLVGGSTRTPLVREMLHNRLDLDPHEEIHPDLCVALGAGVLASRIDGREISNVLVDVSPYSFGISFLGELGGEPYPHCYKPIIRANSALPVTRTDRYTTAVPYQREARIDVFQGEDPDALRNVPVGSFTVEDLTPREGPNQILCKMRLDLDGMLNVSAIEKETGHAKHVAIDGALARKSEAEIEAARERLEALFGERVGEGRAAGAAPEDASARDGSAQSSDWREAVARSDALVGRSQRLLEKMHAEDKEEAVDLHEAIRHAVESGDEAALSAAVRELEDLVFFVEGR
ncbi:MAG: Hsp70 family protein [Polyangia bacterium]